MRSALRLHRRTIYLSPAPLYHAAPARLVDVGAAPRGHRRGDGAIRPAECLAPHRAPPGDARPVRTDHFVRMLKLPEDVRVRYDLSSLRSVVHAAAPCPVEVKQRMLDWWGPIIDEYYAGTEDIGSTSIDPPSGSPTRGRWGRSLAGLHIVGADGGELPDGGAGRSASRAVGLSSTTTTHEDRRGEQRAVEHARRHRPPRRRGLPVPDRPSAHMIIAGGVNIYPAGGRERADRAPGGRRRGRDRRARRRHGGGGEGGRAAGRPVGAAGPDLAASSSPSAATALATYKCPRSVDFVDELPATPHRQAATSGCYASATGRPTGKRPIVS